MLDMGKWKEFAKTNNLTINEFKTEIYFAAAIFATMEIESADGDNDQMTLTYSHPTATTEMCFTRTNND